MTDFQERTRALGPPGIALAFSLVRVFVHIPQNKKDFGEISLEDMGHVVLGILAPITILNHFTHICHTLRLSLLLLPVIRLVRERPGRVIQTGISFW
jgi:hypothetical protein